MSVVIAPATSDDLEDVAGLEKVIEGGATASLEVIKNRFDMFPDGFFIARLNDLMIGYAESCMWDEDIPSFNGDINFFSDRHSESGRVLYIIFIGVLPEFQRQGIAGELIKSLQSLAHQKGRKVHAVTWKHLLPLYTSQGFYPVRDMPAFLPKGDFTLLEYIT